MTELMPSLCNDCVARNQCGNDDVKMCISYTKETKIKCDDCKFVENCVDYGWQECKKFTPKPSEPMTNEEWLRSCPPQELIRFLMNVAYGGQIRSVQKSTFDEEAEKWSKWLKEKHTE